MVLRHVKNVLNSSVELKRVLIVLNQQDKHMRSWIDRWSRPIIGFWCHHNIWTALTALADKIKSDMRWKGIIHSYEALCRLAKINNRAPRASLGKIIIKEQKIHNGASLAESAWTCERTAHNKLQQEEPSGMTGRHWPVSPRARQPHSQRQLPSSLEANHKPQPLQCL